MTSEGRFRFKKFDVGHARSAMKIGTDGVILGSWFDAGPAGCRILDIGTGTGLIALMAAQRNPTAAIAAVECDQGACLDAAENFSSSPWHSNLTLHESTIQEYAAVCAAKFDRIVTNPPYFTDSLKNPDEGRRTARHTDSLPFEELLDSACALLADDGVFSVILPVEEARVFTVMAGQKGLFPLRTLLVYPKAGGEAKRAATEYSFRDGDVSAEELVIEAGGRHRYSEEYRVLTGDFYLNF